jgi:hypothetical protein
MLFGHEFNFTDAPNRYGLPLFYSLHAWVWKDNPVGTFEMWNPSVHCDWGLGARGSGLHPSTAAPWQRPASGASRHGSAGGLRTPATGFLSGMSSDPGILFLRASGQALNGVAKE